MHKLRFDTTRFKIPTTLDMWVSQILTVYGNDQLLLFWKKDFFCLSFHTKALVFEGRAV